ncbi:MAG: HAD family phosphatase [Thermoguttaceae bacterium]|nr:HAD family phosphatase [Thermoguttaceae bacterium]
MNQTPEFIFFDLGKVLLEYDFSIAEKRLNALTGLDGKAVMDATLAQATPICEAIETDRMSSRELYLWVIENFGMTLAQEEFEAAHRDIFSPMTDSWEMIKDLKAAGIRMGILSNICRVHWDFCVSRFPELFQLFDVPLSSVELKARKPGREVYLRAAERAGTDPSKILFFDDRPENIEGAKNAGFDAVLFTDTRDARSALQTRGLLRS